MSSTDPSFSFAALPPSSVSLHSYLQEKDQATWSLFLDQKLLDPLLLRYQLAPYVSPFPHIVSEFGFDNELFRIGTEVAGTLDCFAMRWRMGRYRLRWTKSKNYCTFDVEGVLTEISRTKEAWEKYVFEQLPRELPESLNWRLIYHLGMFYLTKC